MATEIGRRSGRPPAAPTRWRPGRWPLVVRCSCSAAPCIQQGRICRAVSSPSATTTACRRCPVPTSYWRRSASRSSPSASPHWPSSARSAHARQPGHRRTRRGRRDRIRARRRHGDLHPDLRLPVPHRDRCRSVDRRRRDRAPPAAPAPTRRSPIPDARPFCDPTVLILQATPRAERLRRRGRLAAWLTWATRRPCCTTTSRRLATT